MSDGLARVHSRRTRSQAIPQHCLPPHAGDARTNQKRIASQRTRIVTRFQVSVVNIAVEYIVLAASKSRRGYISPARISRYSMRELCGTVNVENIVVEGCAVCPSLPISLQQKVHVLVLSHIDGVVVNRRVSHWPGYVDTPRVIVLTDVVAHDSADIADVFAGIVAALVADQHKAAVIVVAVVVLNDRIATVPISVKALTVALPVGQIDLIKLDYRIVRTPRPDTHIKSFGPLF